MSTVAECNTIVEEIEWLFGQGMESIAGMKTVEQRRRQLPVKALIQTLVLGCLEQPRISLEGLSSVASDMGYTISASGIHQRLTLGLAEVMREMVMLALHHRPMVSVDSGHPLKGFDGVYIIDSTQVRLPDHLREAFPANTKPYASLKLQLCYDYQQQAIEALEIGGGSSPDQKCDLSTQYTHPHSLVLMDLGYFKQERFQAIAQQKGYFVSRLQSQTALYVAADSQADESETDQRLDLLVYLSQHHGQVVDIKARLGARVKLPVRLIALPLPAEVVEQRRKKAKRKAKKQHKTCSENHLALLAWHILITNLDDCYSPAQLHDLYALRMQIEWLFRVYKSEFDLDHNPNWRAARVLCQFYARLLAVILAHWLAQPIMTDADTEYSLTKCVHQLRRHVHVLLAAIDGGIPALTHAIHYLLNQLRRFSRKTKRIKQPSTWQILRNWSLT